MLLLAVFNAQALGLGDLHVNSRLGDPLDVRVDLLKLSAADARDLKVKLADLDEYRHYDLVYPDGFHFKFQLVNKRGKQPYIHILTREYVNEPFLTLLLEVVSSSVKFTKDYTFLIDPPPELFVTGPASPEVPAKKKRHKRSASAAQRVVRKGAGGASRSGEQDKRRSGSSYAGTVSGEAARTTDPFAAMPGNSLKLTMSTSLSISRGAPEPGAEMSADALQEELIAKEKAVTELKEQISEMQAVIKILQLKLAVQTGSSVPASGVLVQSAATPTAQPKPPPKKAAPAKTAAPSVWPKVVGFFVLLVLAGGGGYFWYRRRQQAQQPKTGLFDELATPADAMHQRVKTGVAQTSSEQAMKMPANKELKTVPFTAREYDFLEQAEIYLRFGHDKLAEDVLREAIRINPLNPHGYLTLLGIYETRGDKSAFYTLAQQLKAIGDGEEWRKVAETGRRLDPDNPFYA